MLPVYSYDESTFTRWWEALKKYQPTIIYAYPSVAADFSRWLEGVGYQPKSVKGVFCSAEVLFPNHRNIIERVFNCKVYNQYGSRETPCVACECPEGNLHVFVDLNRVEFLPEPEEIGRPQRIIVTPLRIMLNLCSDMILGDLGTPKEGLCPCGRGFPLMEMDLGRENDHIRATDGRIIYPSFFIHLLDGKKWIRHFQFRQVKPDGLELVMEADFLPDIQEHVNRLASEMLPHLQGKMGAGIKLNIRAVPFIERTSAGKHRFVINEIEENK